MYLKSRSWLSRPILFGVCFVRDLDVLVHTYRIKFFARFLDCWLRYNSCIRRALPSTPEITQVAYLPRFLVSLSGLKQGVSLVSGCQLDHPAHVERRQTHAISGLEGRGEAMVQRRLSVGLSLDDPIAIPEARAAAVVIPLAVVGPCY